MNTLSRPREAHAILVFTLKEITRITSVRIKSPTLGATSTSELICRQGRNSLDITTGKKWVKKSRPQTRGLQWEHTSFLSRTIYCGIAGETYRGKVNKNKIFKDRQKHLCCRNSHASELRLFERFLQSLLSATRHTHSRRLHNMRGNTVVLNNNSRSPQLVVAVRRFEKEGISGAFVLSGPFLVYVNTIG